MRKFRLVGALLGAVALVGLAFTMARVDVGPYQSNNGYDFVSA